MPFYDDVRAEVLQHGAIHNSFLTRFQAGHISDEEFDEFAIQFYSFARCFPASLPPSWSTLKMKPSPMN